MADRKVPYPAFNFSVSFGGAEIFGGFSDVSGITTELTVAEYRAGNDPDNHVRKIQGVHKVSDITLKRGLISAESVWNWINDARTKGPDAKKTVVISLYDETHQKVVQKWTAGGVLPLKWTGPTLAGKGGGDVAMEELVLSCESLIYGDAGA
jgi:phage tail-like protein